jgi:hypothetical protein
MKQSLKKARQIAAATPNLASFDIHVEGEELHLSKKGEVFARLIATGKPDEWRMEYFFNRERWEIIDFVGTLEECLAFLVDNPHYLFWEG